MHSLVHTGVETVPDRPERFQTLCLQCRHQLVRDRLEHPGQVTVRVRLLDVVEHGEQLTGDLGLGHGDDELAVALYPAAVVAVLGGDALQVTSPLIQLGPQRVQLWGARLHINGSRSTRLGVPAPTSGLLTSLGGPNLARHWIDPPLVSHDNSGLLLTSGAI